MAPRPPLPRGANALPPGRAAGLQRERLIAAQLTVCARHGYAGSSVARVVAAAGVSRATFYKHFPSGEDCFLAAYREAAAELREAVSAAGLAAAPPQALAAALDALLATVAADPAGARLALLEALGAAPIARREREELAAEAATALGWLLARAEGRGEALQAPPALLLGGLAGVISLRAFRGEGDAVGALSEPLLAWLRSYVLPPGARRLCPEEWEALGAGIPDPPRGRPDELEDQRSRIRAAVARICREQGYAAMTVADVVVAASVSRQSFYGHFDGKEDAFAATQEAGLRETAGEAAASFFAGGTWPDRVWNGLDALFTYTARHRDLASVDLVESYAAGPAAVRRSIDNRLAFTLFLEEGYRQRPQAERLPRLCSEAISAAGLELMRREAVAGRTEHLRRLLPQAVYVALAPFLGPVEALDFVRRKLA